jgi:hypothetical protein
MAFPMLRSIVMLRIAPAVALCAAACGEVGQSSVDSGVDSGVDAPPTGSPRIFRGTMDELAPVTFGGSPYCTYHITLKQLQVDIGIAPSGEVASGHVQALNVESVVPSTVPNCPPDYEVIAPNIAMYSLQSVSSAGGLVTLTFQGITSNNPPADLTIELTSIGSAYQAKLGFHRTNVDPPLDWSIIATVSLSAQPMP